MGEHIGMQGRTEMLGGGERRAGEVAGVKGEKVKGWLDRGFVASTVQG